VDLCFGLIVISMSIFVYRPVSGYSPVNTVLALFAMAADYSHFRAGKKFITRSRMGQVEFGTERKRRKPIMVIALRMMVLFQVILFLLTFFIWTNHEWSVNINHLLPEKGVLSLMVASIGSLMVGTSMLLGLTLRISRVAISSPSWSPWPSS
jgi:hypothetical protein